MLPALLQQAEQAGFLRQSRLDVQGVPRLLPPDVGLAVYRTVQESITNAARHDPTGRALVTMSYLPEEVTVEVVTISAGPAASTAGTVTRASGGFGLRGLAERAQLLGGRLDAEALPDGYRVGLLLPTATRG